MKREPCQGWTSRREFRNNLPCGNQAQPGKNYCKVHDPDFAAERERRLKVRMESKRGHENNHG